MQIMVIMSCYNGGKYLQEQLDSLLQQSCPCTRIIIRDDASTDNTTCILNEYSTKYSIIDWVQDELGHLGVVQSYAILFKYAVSYQADYFLIADQDDFWLPYKIEKSLAKIQMLAPHKPALVFSDVNIVDEQLVLIHPSFTVFQHLQHQHIITLKKLLFYSPALGCTMLFNQALLKLTLNSTMKNLNPDKWLLTLAAIYGNITYLPEPTLLYRQHSANVTGAMQGIQRKILTCENVSYLQKRYQAAVNQAREILRTMPLDENHKKLIQQFIAMFTQSYRLRIINYLRFCTTPPHWKRKLDLLFSLFFKYQ